MLALKSQVCTCATEPTDIWTKRQIEKRTDGLMWTKRGQNDKRTKKFKAQFCFCEKYKWTMTNR